MTTLATLRSVIRAGRFWAAGLAMFGAGSLRAADWPQHLGPSRDGHAAGEVLFRTWPQTGPEIAWRRALGEGYSGAAITGRRLVTLESEAGTEAVIAIDVATGETIWRTPVGRHRQDPQGGGPRATPAIDGGRVHAVGATGRLVTLDIGDGSEIWSVDLVADYGAVTPEWGVSASPLVEGDVVVVVAGGRKNRSIIAFEAATGAVRWSSEKDRAAYASPIAVEIGGVRQIVAFTASGLVGVGADDGRRLWRAPWKTSYDVNAATPLFVPASGLFVSSGYDTGAALLQIVREVDGFEAYQVWRNKEMRNEFGTSVLVGQHVYGFDDDMLKAVDVLTGTTAWRSRAGGKGSVLHADGHLLVLGGNGTLYLAPATPEAFEPASEHRVTRGRTWAAPALSNGLLFVRAQREIVAVRVGPASSGPNQNQPPRPGSSTQR